MHIAIGPDRKFRVKNAGLGGSHRWCHKVPGRQHKSQWDYNHLLQREGQHEGKTIVVLLHFCMFLRRSLQQLSWAAGRTCAWGIEAEKVKAKWTGFAPWTPSQSDACESTRSIEREVLLLNFQSHACGGKTLISSWHWSQTLRFNDSRPSCDTSGLSYRNHFHCGILDLTVGEEV